MIDISVLRDFSGGDKEFELDIVQTYIDESGYYSSLLESNFNNGNLQEVARVAHKLKSSISVFGLAEFHQLLNKLEEKCNQPPVDEFLSKLVIEVLQYNEDITSEMQEIKAKITSLD